MEHVWCDNLLISPSEVFSSHQINQAVIYLCTMRQKESTPWCEFVEEKEVLVLPNCPMIPLQGFLFDPLVFFKLSFFWKGHAINSLELVFGGISKPVRCRMLCNGKGLNDPSVLDVRASAQVNEVT